MGGGASKKAAAAAALEAGELLPEQLEKMMKVSTCSYGIEMQFDSLFNQGLHID